MARMIGRLVWRASLAMSRSPGTRPFAAVDDQDQHIGLLERALPAFEHQRVQRILAGPEHASGIYELEARALPLRGLGDHVARGAREWPSRWRAGCA